MQTAYCRRGISYRRVACRHKAGGIPARVVSGGDKPGQWSAGVVQSAAEQNQASGDDVDPDTGEINTP
jgi:hypothetical protein